MPKDEFDPQDPLQLTGIALPDPEGSALQAMAECFVEEFLWMGQEPAQILKMFRNPSYSGPHLVYRRKGERYVGDLIEAVCARLRGEATTDPVSGAQNGARTAESGGKGHA